MLTRTPAAGTPLFRKSTLSIGTRLTICFLLIVLAMIAADAIAFWQFRLMLTPNRRLSNADQISLAIVRVRLDVDTFREKVAALENSHDSNLFASEATSLRENFLANVEDAQQMLRKSPELAREDPTIPAALETVKLTLPSQLDTAVQLANAGDWNAVRLRLKRQIQILIDLSSSLVAKVDHQAQQQRTKAIEDAERAYGHFLVLVPIAGLLTLVVAVALGWYVTQSITIPLAELASGAQALARGDFSHVVNVGGNDELALVAGAFNHAGRQLQVLYQELRDLIESIPATVWTTSPDGTVDFVNGRWQELTGLPPVDALGWNWEAAVHPDDRDRFVAEWKSALNSGQAMETEVRVQRANGEYCWLFVRNVPLRNESGNIIKWYGTGIDIDDRKRVEQERERLRQLESRLAHIDRVNLMGELAASLAHEIKQPIAAAVTNAQACLRFLERSEPDMSEVRESAAAVVACAKRSAEIIEGIRSLFRQSAAHTEVLEVNELIQEIAILLQGEIARCCVALHLKLAEHLPAVIADRVQLQQVLMNLMLNGIEAMRETGGELTVTSQLGDSGKVLVSIRDTGPGIPADKLSEIFKPYFTTKPQGTGMGLAISRSIIESHGGRLWVTTNSEHGAIFHFTLPQHTEALAVQA